MNYNNSQDFHHNLQLLSPCGSPWDFQKSLFQYPTFPVLLPNNTVSLISATYVYLDRIITSKG